MDGFDIASGQRKTFQVRLNDVDDDGVCDDDDNHHHGIDVNTHDIPGRESRDKNKMRMWTMNRLLRRKKTHLPCPLL